MQTPVTLRLLYVPAAIVPPEQVADPGRAATALEATTVKVVNASRTTMLRIFLI
jgi:hypothetical protein